MSNILTQDERQKFLAALVEDPAFLDEVRRLIVTQELLSLPDAFIRLVGMVGLLTQEVRLLAKEVREGFDRVDARFDRMDERFDRVDARFDRMDKRFDRMDPDMAQLKGGHYESVWRENAPSYLGSRGYRRVQLIGKADLTTLLEDAIDDGRLTDSSVGDDILLLDSLHRARRTADNAEVVVASEVSSRVHRDDVERALRRTEAIGAILGVPSVACVVGASVDQPAESAAEAAGVLIVLPAEWRRAYADT